MPVVFSPGKAGHPCPTLRAHVPFPQRRNQRQRTGRYRKGMISAPRSYQGVRRSVSDPEIFAPGQKSRAVARPTGRAVSRKRLSD